MNNASEPTSEVPGGSKTAYALSVFMFVLLCALIVGAPVGFLFGIGFLKVLAVSLALATSGSLIPVLDDGWFAIPLEMTMGGLIAASLIWLLFGTGFFTVLTISLVLGILIPLLRGEEFRERERLRREQIRKKGREDRERKDREREKQRQQEARLKEAEQERLKREQEERSDRPGRQVSSGDRRTVPVPLHELRAIPYKEYLQTPHWKRRREDKLRAVGRRCQLCNSGSRILDVHHRTYERRGEELDEDLTVLCRACHSTFHKHRGLGR